MCVYPGTVQSVWRSGSLRYGCACAAMGHECEHYIVGDVVDQLPKLCGRPVPSPMCVCMLAVSVSPPCCRRLARANVCVHARTHTVH